MPSGLPEGRLALGLALVQLAPAPAAQALPLPAITCVLSRLQGTLCLLHARIACSPCPPTLPLNARTVIHHQQRPAKRTLVEMPNPHLKLRPLLTPSNQTRTPFDARTPLALTLGAAGPASLGPSAHWTLGGTLSLLALHLGPQRTQFFGSNGGWNWLSQLGPKHALLLPDMRGERCMDRIVSKESWGL